MRTRRVVLAGVLGCAAFLGRGEVGADGRTAAALGEAKAHWEAGRLVAAQAAVLGVFEETAHALVEQARSLLPPPAAGWREEPLDPGNALYRSSADGLRRGAFTVARVLRRDGGGRVIVSFRRLDAFEEEIEQDLLEQVRGAGKLGTERGRPAWREEWTAGRRMLHLRLASPRAWVDLAADADVGDAELAAHVAALRLDDMEAVTAADPAPPAPPYDPAVLFPAVAEALAAGRYAWALERGQALHYGIHMTRWRRVVASLPAPREGWGSEEPPLVPGDLYPTTILARRYFRGDEADVWVVLNARPEMLEGHRRGLAELGAEGASRIVSFRGRRAIRVTAPANDTESLAVLLGGEFVLVVSVRPIARQELAEPYFAALDLEAIERAWRASS